MRKAYVHGYDSRESIRRQDQASTLVELRSATAFPGASSMSLPSRGFSRGVQANSFNRSRISPAPVPVAVRPPNNAIQPTITLDISAPGEQMLK